MFVGVVRHRPLHDEAPATLWVIHVGRRADPAGRLSIPKQTTALAEQASATCRGAFQLLISSDQRGRKLLVRLGVRCAGERTFLDREIQSAAVDPMRKRTLPPLCANSGLDSLSNQ